MATVRRKPAWLRVRLSSNPASGRVEEALARHGLKTVCQEALCPNRAECFGRGTATFLLLGGVCTRHCTFCAVKKGRPGPLDPAEPLETAQAAVELKLDFVVLTSVTRDDLPDGGASVFAQTVRAIKKLRPEVKVEVLVPDFGGDEEALAAVLAAGPEVLNHNLETVPRLYAPVRPEAEYRRSLKLLARAKEISPFTVTKTGLMVGLGESEGELRDCFKDMAAAKVDVLTLGQYLSPSTKHHPVMDYLEPAAFDRLKELALKTGLKACASGPLVRSSYQAKSLHQEVHMMRQAQAGP